MITLGQMVQNAFAIGEQDYHKGYEVEQNPFSECNSLAAHWVDGWNAACAEDNSYDCDEHYYEWLSKAA